MTQFFDLLDPPVLALEIELIRASSDKSQELRLDRMAAMFRVKNAVGENKAAGRQQVAHLASGILVRFAQVARHHGVGVAL